LKFRNLKITEYLRENRKTVVLCFAATCILFALICITETGGDKIYFEDERGNLSALNLEAGGQRSAALKVTGFRDGVSVSRNAVITMGGEESKNTDIGSDEPDTGDSIRKSLDEAIRTVENSEGARAELPRVLEDGTMLLWEKPDSTGKYTILMLFPAMVLFFYNGEKEKHARIAREKKDSVLKTLPSFNSQILLLLGSGLIFEEAFGRVADGYEARKKRNYFEDVIVEIRKKAVESNVSVVRIMDIRSSEIGVREFTRVKEIIVTARYKGNDLSEKLADEGEILWNRRKKAAEEKGKLAETRLSGPLAMLLLALIGVTAAPAMMQM
jgi:tight adherence protein C